MAVKQGCGLCAADCPKECITIGILEKSSGQVCINGFKMEAGEVIISANKQGIDVIHLVAPQTPDERLDIILRGAGGWIYFVSVEGITGSKEAQEEAIRGKVLKLQAKTDLPIIVGFGINTAQKAADICKFADGAIVGSALIKQISEHLDDEGNIITSKGSTIL